MGLEAAPVKQPKTSSPVALSSSIKTVSARTLLRSSKVSEDTERPEKWCFLGDAGTGKTTKILQLLNKLAIVDRLKPEQIRIELIDLDSGLAELLEQALVPDEYLDSIGYTLCANFPDVVDATTEAFKRLKEHKAKHGLIGTWIIVDNLAKAWQYPQDDYCRAVYGMSLVDKMKQARRTQVVARAEGQKGEGVFNQNLDWGVITPMHNDWAESFVTCGFNFMWLSPWKQEDIKDAENNVIGQHDRFGQKGNELRVSHIVKLSMNAQGQRIGEFTKSRTTKALPKNMKDTTFVGILKELKKLEDYEKQQKVSEMKKLVFPTDEAAKMNENINAATAISQPTEVKQVAKW